MVGESRSRNQARVRRLWHAMPILMHQERDRRRKEIRSLKRLLHDGDDRAGVLMAE